MRGAFFLFAVFSISLQSLGAQDIADQFKKMVENGQLKNLHTLELLDKKLFDAVTAEVSDKGMISAYYYEISPQDGIITVALWHRDRFDKKWETWLGDPSGLCFSLEFDGSYKMLRKYRWQ